MSKPTIIVTGGAGFIGSSVCRYLVLNSLAKVINVDALTYAANLSSVGMLEGTDDYIFEQADICDAARMKEIFEKYKPAGVMHLAAESHVDRSITGAQEFIQTNVVGTSVLLDVSLGYWPVVISNCSNNYGPYHFPEKLIPLVILNALHHKKLPIYGDGSNVRDWLYVDDHAKAIWTIWSDGKLGEKYNVGGRNERSNLEVVKTICRILDEMKSSDLDGGYESLIEYVTDRPGHDARYAIDATKLENELGWKAEENFDSGIKKTVKWYLENESWWRPIIEGKYSGERLGLEN